MLRYKHVTTYQHGKGYWQSSLADLELMTVNGRHILAAASELIGGGLSLYRVGGADRAIEQSSVWGYRSDFIYQGSPDIAVVEVGTQTYLHLSHIGRAEPIGMSVRANGVMQGFHPILPHEELGTGFSSLGQVVLPGGDLIYASHNDGINLTVFHTANESGPAWVGEYSFDRPGLHPDSSLDKVIDASSGKSHFLVAVSGIGDFISTHRISKSGEIQNASVHYTQTGTGISAPTDLAVIEYAGKTLIVVAAPGSSSLTVFQLMPNGHLTPLDHVIDEGFTSFQGLSAFDTVEFQGRPYLFAGGTDGGITVFTLLPDGKLLHVKTIADDFEMVLSEVSDIETAVIGGKIALFASSITDSGITQLVFDPGTIGVTGARRGSRVVSGEDNDMLLSLRENRYIDGGAGDDILVARTVSSYGDIWMTGGAGRDIFVPREVNGRIIITDFELGKDLLDLSQLGAVRSVYDLDFRGTDARMRVQFHDTKIDIFTKQGRVLTEADFTNDMFPIAHYVLPKMLRDRIDPDERVSDTGDHIFGTQVSDLLTGGRGPDFIIAGKGYDTVNAGIGNDTVRGNKGGDILFGQAGEDLILGGSGNDRIGGGDGNDRLFGELGFDTLFGGVGADRLEGGGQRDVLYGLAGADTIYGGHGHDRAFGGGGNDLIIGSAGRDMLDGGSGNDRLNGGVLADKLIGGAGADKLFGGHGQDILSGGAGNDTVIGGTEGDRIYGWSGRDFLNGEAGNDSLSGGTGEDTIYGGAGRDSISGDLGHDRLLGQEGDDTLLGRAGDDKLQGAGGQDHLSGGVGNDSLFGGDRGDVIYGNHGDDVLVGGQGHDRLFAGKGKDLLMGDAGGDLLDGGSGADTIGGKSGNDQLLGRSGKDSIFGGLGNDTLTGGADQDRLWGGAGNDVFVFTRPSSSSVSAPDRIAGFQPGDDLIDISSLKLSFIGRKAFSDDHQLRWEYHAQDTHIVADINGDGRADTRIVLTGRHALTADDFLL